MEIDHNSKTISDKITALGELEHALYHARKSAGVKADDKDATIFFQTVATMCLNFRRKYMKKYFPDCTDEDWCLGKAIEIARQRVYEADEGDAEDLNEVDAIWNMVWGKITGKDLSGCSSCKEDKPDHKSFINKWVEYYAGESNIDADMLYKGANKAIRQGPIEVNIKKVFHVGAEPTYFLYWRDVDMEKRWLEYSTLTALLNEWEPVWKKGMFDSDK